MGLTVRYRIIARLYEPLIFVITVDPGHSTRKGESSIISGWIPAFAGMTIKDKALRCFLAVPRAQQEDQVRVKPSK
jgi:hypothetical protein